jgi:large subunit ribosomal protein L29
MANSLTAQLRVSTEEELQAKLAEAKEELFNLRFQGATGQLESHGRLRAVRKEIARIYTVMRERELGIITLIEDSGEPEAGEPVAVAAGSAARDARADSAEDDAAEEAGK